MFLGCTKPFHLYYSLLNPGAAEMAGSLVEASGDRLRVTSDPSQRDFDVRCFLLYLNRVSKHLCVCVCVARLVVSYASLATQVSGTLTFATSSFISVG